MDKKEYKQQFFGKSLCADCVHNYFNNGENIGGCRAFPDGIPEEAKCGHNHKQPMSGQVGDFIFREATYEELTPIAQYFWNKRDRD